MCVGLIWSGEPFKTKQKCQTVQLASGKKAVILQTAYDKDHMGSLGEYSLAVESNLQLIAIKKMGATVLKLQGNEFSQKHECIWKKTFISRRGFSLCDPLISAMWDPEQKIQICCTWTSELQIFYDNL